MWYWVMKCFGSIQRGPIIRLTHIANRSAVNGVGAS